MRRSPIVLAGLLALPLAACVTAASAPDAAPEGPHDSGAPRGTMKTPDAAPPDAPGALDDPDAQARDAARPPGPDAGADAVADAGQNAAHDGRAPEADGSRRDAADAGRDAVVDAGIDVVVDAGIDVVADAGIDVAVDAGIDAAETCSDGTPIAYTRASCPGAPATVPAGLASAASSAAAGDVVSMGSLDEGSLPCFPVRVCVPASAPTLVFSDDPESPSTDGVLYADELAAGSYRAYVYHTNAGGDLRSFPVVLLNQGASTVHAQIVAEGVAGPSQDYVDVGKQALLRWLSSGASGAVTTVDVPPGERVVLSTSLAALQASTSDLVHGIVDFSVDGPVKLSVVSILSTEDPTVVTAGLGLLPDDGVHARGTFPGADLEIESIGAVDGAGVRHLRLGADVTDESLVGHDYVDGTSVTLGGNYGVSYAIRVDLQAPTAFLLSPQGGDWGGAARVSGNAVLLPAAEDALGSQTQAIALWASAGGGAGATGAAVNFLTAGGSNLPVDLVTVPTE